MYNDTTPWLNASTPEEFIDKATYHFDKADFNGAVQRNDSDVSRWSARQYELGHALRYVVRGTERFPDDERLKQLMFDGVWMLSESIFYATLLDRNPMNVFPDTFIVRSHWRRGEFRRIESDVVNQIQIPELKRKAIRVLGMPYDQAPNLSFFFEPIRCTEFIPHDAILSPAYEHHMATHWAIGRTAEADLLAISEEYEGIIVRLHHEFGYATRQYANESYAHFLISVEQYAEVLEELAKIDDLLTTDFDDTMHDYYGRAHMIDTSCMAHGSFWGGLADDLVVEWRKRRIAKRDADSEARYAALVRAVEEEHEDEMMLRRELGPLFDNDDFVNGKIPLPDHLRYLDKAPFTQA
jgi:hypothetical protein